MSEGLLGTQDAGRLLGPKEKFFVRNAENKSGPYDANTGIFYMNADEKAQMLQEIQKFKAEGEELLKSGDPKKVKEAQEGLKYFSIFEKLAQTEGDEVDLNKLPEVKAELDKMKAQARKNVGRRLDENSFLVKLREFFDVFPGIAGRMDQSDYNNMFRTSKGENYAEKVNKEEGY